MALILRGLLRASICAPCKGVLILAGANPARYRRAIANPYQTLIDLDLVAGSWPEIKAALAAIDFPRSNLLEVVAAMQEELAQVTTARNEPADAPTIVKPGVTGNTAAGAGRGQDEPPRPVYSIERKGDIWTIQFDSEQGQFNESKPFGRLRDLLARPNKVISVAELIRDPQAKIAADADMRADHIIDAGAVAAMRRRIEEIQQITEATGGSESLEAEFEGLLNGLKPANQQIATATKRMHHTISTGIRTFIRGLQGTMPKLAKHLDESLDLSFPDFRYHPESDISWKI